MNKGEKTCLECEHCDLFEGRLDTEFTPGDPFEWMCRRGHWTFASIRTIRPELERAPTCEDFKEYKPKRKGFYFGRF